MSAAKKGDKIYFCGGKYFGLRGWINNSKDSTEFYMYVLVDLGEGEIKATRVLKENIGVGRSKKGSPDTFQEAIFEQHPDIEKVMKLLARELARCDLSVIDAQETTEVFGGMLLNAVFKQSLLGNKACFRKVVFD